jgi:predicted acetyltransferase
MKLVELTPAHYSSFYEMALEYNDYGDNRYMNFIPEEKFTKFLHKLEINKNGETVPSHLVPGFSYWLEDEKSGLLGGIRFRTRLNDQLLIEGGHIGYDIRPTVRNKGLATAMVSLLFEKIKDQKIEKVLITCFDDNPASEKVILKLGGKLESIEPSPRNGKMSKRFWVEIPQ